MCCSSSFHHLSDSPGPDPEMKVDTRTGGRAPRNYTTQYADNSLQKEQGDCRQLRCWVLDVNKWSKGLGLKDVEEEF